MKKSLIAAAVLMAALGASAQSAVTPQSLGTTQADANKAALIAAAKKTDGVDKLKPASTANLQKPDATADATGAKMAAKKADLQKPEAKKAAATDAKTAASKATLKPDAPVVDKAAPAKKLSAPATTKLAGADDLKAKNGWKPDADGLAERRVAAATAEDDLRSKARVT